MKEKQNGRRQQGMFEINTNYILTFYIHHQYSLKYSTCIMKYPIQFFIKIKKVVTVFNKCKQCFISAGDDSFYNKETRIV